MTPEFKLYSQQTKANASALSDRLVSLGHTIASGGTSNHLVLWDLKPAKVTGSKMEKICDACNITLNKNCVPGDRSAITPGGVRIGAPALTTRMFLEKDFVRVGDILDRTLKAAQRIQAKSGPKLKDFEAALVGDEEVKAIKEEVNRFATGFPMPGFETEGMRYKNPLGPDAE